MEGEHKPRVGHVWDDSGRLSIDIKDNQGR